MIFVFFNWKNFAKISQQEPRIFYSVSNERLVLRKRTGNECEHWAMEFFFPKFFRKIMRCVPLPLKWCHWKYMTILNNTMIQRLKKEWFIYIVRGNSFSRFFQFFFIWNFQSESLKSNQTSWKICPNPFLLEFKNADN